MQTNRHRLNRFLQGIKFSIRKNQHHAIKDQIMSINQKLRGHINYFGIYGNTARIQKVRYEALLYFRKILCHRSQSGKVTWDKTNHILKVIPMAEAKLRLPYAQFKALSSV